MHILVTGSTGYIGARFLKIASSRSHAITCTARLNNYIDYEHNILFDIENKEKISIPKYIDAVIHLAANTHSDSNLASDDEIHAAELLLRASKEIGAKFLFVSSQASHPHSSTGYGKTKWLIEEKVLSYGGIVARPGLVYGGPLRGLFGALAQIINSFPILPQLYPSPLIQPIHVDDLVYCLIKIIECNDIRSRVFFLANKEPIKFNLFIKNLSRLRLRSIKILIPVPIFFIKIALSLFFIPKSGIWKKKFEALLENQQMNVESDLDFLDVKLRSLNNGMNPSGSLKRRNLLLEGKSLITYILRSKPRTFFLKHYVRVLEELEDAKPLGLPSEFITFPFLISIIYSRSFPILQIWEIFQRRLHIAATLAESTVVGAKRFMKCNEKSNAYDAIIGVLSSLFCECISRFIGFILAPLVRIRFIQNKEMCEY